MGSKKLQIPSYIEFIPINSNRAIFSTPLETKELTGDTVSNITEIVPILREGATMSEISNQTGIEMKILQKIVEKLESENLVHPKEAEDGFFEWGCDESEEARSSLQDTIVGVVGDIEISLTNLLPEQNIRRINEVEAIPEHSDVSILVSACKGARPEFHRAILDLVWDSKIRWLPSRVVGTEIRIGPFTRRNIDCCYQCYYSRYLASEKLRPKLESEHSQREINDQYPEYPGPAFDLLSTVTQFEIMAILTDYAPVRSDGSVLYVDLFTLESNMNDVLKLPGCEICGTN